MAAFFTRSLLDLPTISLTDVSRIIQANSATATARKDKGFKLYVSNYVHNYEGEVKIKCFMLA